MVFSDSTWRNNSEWNVSFLVYYISVPLLQCEHTFPPPIKISEAVLYQLVCSVPTDMTERTAGENSLTVQEKGKCFFFLFFCSFFSLLYHCFKINFRSDLQKLRYQKHMYFRYCLGRVRQFLFVHFHWGKQFPQNKTCECTDYHWMWSFPSSA